MKWVVFLACVGLCPVLAGLLRSRKTFLWAAFAMGLLPFIMGSFALYFALISWGGWPEFPKGLEASVLDFLAISVLIASRGKIQLSGLMPWVLYTAAVLIAVPHATQPEAGIFYVWQLVRMTIVFLAAVRLAQIPGAPERMLHGVICGVIFQAYYAITQYAGGVNEPGGAFGAKNLLGLMTNFALVPSMGLLLIRRTGLWPIVGVALSLLLDFLTASRATLALAGVGLGLMIVFSCFKGMTGRKGAVLGLSVALTLVLVPVALHSVASRGQEAIDSSNIERDAFKRAAWMIIRDYPFGTGPNQYVLVANVGGYSARAGVVWNSGSRGTAVHNSYLLVLAETGLLGLVTMVLLLAYPILKAIRAAFRYKREPSSELLLGFGVGLLAISLHLLYEWAFITFIVQYMFASYAGIAVGMSRRLASAEGREPRADSVGAVLSSQGPQATSGVG